MSHPVASRSKSLASPHRLSDCVCYLFTFLERPPPKQQAIRDLLAEQKLPHQSGSNHHYMETIEKSTEKVTWLKFYPLLSHWFQL